MDAITSFVERALHAFSLNDNSTVSDTLQKDKLDSFIFFPRLPGEIRVEIWRAIARLPRVVVMHEVFDTDQTGQSHPHGETRKSILIQKVTPTLPPVLFACLESRKACRSFYQPLRSTMYKMEYLDGQAYRWTATPFSHLVPDYIKIFADTIYWTCPRISEKDNHAVDDSYWRESCSRLPRIQSLKSVAFNANELKVRYDTTDVIRDMAGPLFYLEVFFDLHRDIEEVIIVVKRGCDLPPTDGDLEFVELDEHESDDPVAKEIVEDGFKNIFNWIKKTYKKRLIMYERDRKLYLASLSENIDKVSERRIGAPKPPTPVEPLRLPVLKIMGISKGGVRL
ncbi:hypothetical protein ONS96_005113 [Cadophora gregata f. sp. sojae]|nr:hypothetical protein ONS96_005113 [Cadophora gregata f. sp. sojae]